MISSIQKIQYVTALKKTYSELSQAFLLLKEENEGSIVPVFSGADDGATAMNTFATKLSILKNCGSSTGCWYDTPIYYLNGDISSINFDAAYNGIGGKAILVNGSAIRIDDTPGNCIGTGGPGLISGSVCGQIVIDINGYKGPNTRGRDFFVFWITKTGIIPKGIPDDDLTTCDVNGTTWQSNTGCAAKILLEGAMNY